jgi:putative glutamine amidotransferase
MIFGVATFKTSRLRPLIGITGPNRGGWPAWIATRIAVWRAGGRAIRITPSRPRALDELHGLIIGGGADVNPRLYNEECVGLDARKALRREMRRRWHRREREALTGFSRTGGFHPSPRGQLLAFYRLVRDRVGLIVDFILLVTLWIVRHSMSIPWETAQSDHRGRDELEVPLVREAISRGLPVLGICRGMQLINVCLGGSLYQEISVFYEESPVLTTLLPRKAIEILPTSRLSRIMRRSKLSVNSLHFQSVKTLGEGLIAVARESNGIVQAIEHTGASYIVGVQWHPEYLAFEKPSQQRLFRSLIEAASVARHSPNRAAARAVTPPDTDRTALGKIADSQKLESVGGSGGEGGGVGGGTLGAR